MPPAIVDSEDEDDEILLLDGYNNNRDSVIGKPQKYVTYDNEGASGDRSGSTDRLIVQLQDAARSLCDQRSGQPSMPKMSTTVLSSSLERLKTKRRHSATCTSSQITSPGRTLKRAKTTKDLSPNKSFTPQTVDHSSFATLLPSKSVDVPYSLPSTVNEQFDTNLTPKRVTLDTMQEDFLHHEPTVMFRDTGSTIPDNESDQQIWLEQAIADKQDEHSTSGMASTSSNMHRSSPFPWSTTSTPMALVPANAPAIDPRHSHDNNQVPTPEGPDSNTNELGAPDARIDENIQSNEISENIVLRAEQPAESRQLLREVHIPRGDVIDTDVVKYSEPASSPDLLDHTPKNDKKFKEPSSTEDAAVGLPKELYNPRPSRRRATFMAEEPIDYSLIPEKTAKKRRKTANETQAGAHETVSKKDRASKTSGSELKQSHSIASNEEASAPELDSDVIVIAQDGKGAGSSQPTDNHGPMNSESSPNKKIAGDDIFKMPDKPASSSSTRRTRRHHTTIFEDHIDFVGSQRSPSLKQQQANRKSAMKESQGDDLRLSQRTRRNIAVEDDNAEDELAGETPIVNTSPKKRGRPRKSKAANPEAAEQTEKASKGNLSEVHKKQLGKELLEDQVEEHNLNAEPPSKGTPSKPNLIQTDEPQDPDDDEVILVVHQEPIISPPVIPPPLTEKQPPKDQITKPEKPKGSPTAHSPINSSSKVPLRVGLSRHQRIPSLLRVMRPVKRK